MNNSIWSATRTKVKRKKEKREKKINNFLIRFVFKTFLNSAQTRSACGNLTKGLENEIRSPLGAVNASKLFIWFPLQWNNNARLAFPHELISLNTPIRSRQWKISGSAWHFYSESWIRLSGVHQGPPPHHTHTHHSHANQYGPIYFSVWWIYSGRGGDSVLTGSPPPLCPSIFHFYIYSVMYFTHKFSLRSEGIRSRGSVLWKWLHYSYSESSFHLIDSVLTFTFPSIQPTPAKVRDHRERWRADGTSGISSIWTGTEPVRH